MLLVKEKSKVAPVIEPIGLDKLRIDRLNAWLETMLWLYKAIAFQA